MLTKPIKKPAFYLSVLLIVFLLKPVKDFAQDTIVQHNDSVSTPDSSLLMNLDKKLASDTLLSAVDTNLSKIPEKIPEKKPALKDRVDYSAKDSLRFDVKTRSVTMYNEADIKYQDIKLKAAFVEIIFPDNMLYAKGSPDSTGKDQGIPEFAQGDQTFKSKEIRYNYHTKQGFIQHVVTKQDEGFLHGSTVKKMENNITYLKDGTYTTCSEEVPHFGFKFGRAKVIPGKRVITGPAYMMISGVPTPLAIPFGYFPNRTGRRSGIIIPTYGESNSKGFYLQGLGYYFGISDYMDLEIKGDIFSHGSWALRPSYMYRSRYHFNGQFRFAYAYNVEGTFGQSNYSISKDFSVQWSHAQDAKARPHSKFSANVNIQSNSYNKNTLATNVQTYLSNTFQSNINYATDFNNTFYLTINFNSSQNTLQKTIEVTLPQIVFSVNQFYPFRKKVRSGSMKWYEKISTKYNLDAQNSYSAVDSSFLGPGWAGVMRNGIRHTIPLSATVVVFKYFNWTNSINMTDMMYFQTNRLRYYQDTTGKYHLKSDTVYGFSNAFNAYYSSSVSTRLYGMYQFKGDGLIQAVRHVITPTVSFSYTPNFGAPWLGYWRYIENDTNTVNPRRYSIFQGTLYKGPPEYKSGVVNFSIKNNLEMKVRNRKDTITGTRKIVLIEDFTISTSYDIAKDSLNWSRLNMSGYTTLFKGLGVTYSSSWDPYAMNSKGVRINTSEWKMNRRLFRLDATNWRISLTYSLTSDKAKGKKKTPTTGVPQERKDVLDYYEYYYDFDIPWSFQVNYDFTTTKTWTNDYSHRVGKVVQTLRLSGQLNLTPKWKVSVATGWDFTSSQLSYTSIDVYRDLHCWEMRFGWVPKGGQQNWNFSINVKAQVLQDMKLNKKKDWRDAAY